MFPEIQKAVNEGKVLLEWDKSKGECPKPLIKVRNTISVGCVWF
jgi:hypothetical protein